MKEARPSLPQRLAAEALGTAFLLAAVVGSGIMAQRLSGGNGALALLCNTLPTGAILAVLILMLGPLSGAHFNPAVSTAFALRRELSWPDAGLYVVAQVVGGVAGVWIAHLMFELPLWQVSLNARTGAGQWLAECVATFGLLLTILGCVARTPSAVPYAVGLYITSAYWFTASTSLVLAVLSVGFESIASFEAPSCDFRYYPERRRSRALHQVTRGAIKRHRAVPFRSPAPTLPGR
jgi:glycerol uptake facilitator-like aquaporin